MNPFKPAGQPTLSVAEEALRYYEALLRPVFEGRKFIHAGGLAVGLGREARALALLGAARPFIIAYGKGTGNIPGPEEALLHVHDIQGGNFVDQHQRALAALEHLPGNVRAMIDRWDPDGSARVLCWPSDVPGVAGRKPYAPRKPAWTALEDKTAIDAFWDAAGVNRAPSRIVAAERRALLAAAADLDEGLGTVWAADVRSGIHGGAVGLRWVRPTGDGNAAADSLHAIADRVRVMPFLEGIPVSIHGIVFDEAVAVFRPIEMVVLRPREGDQLLYAGGSTRFDPRAGDREAMRGIARRVGAALRERVDYRGAFTIDGVLSRGGFLPTELNPRIGGALRTLTAGLGNFPLVALCWAVAQGERLASRPDLLERTVLDCADRHRVGGGHAVTDTTFDATRAFRLVRDGSEYREAREGEPAAARLVAGPNPLGGLLSLSLDPIGNERGTSAAPEMSRALRFADRRLGTSFGALETATNVRP